MAVTFEQAVALNKAFDTLVSTIPKSIYFNEGATQEASKWHRKKKDAVPDFKQKQSKREKLDLENADDNVIAEQRKREEESRPQQSKQKTGSENNDNRAKTVSELRSRLQDKLASLQGERKASSGTSEKKREAKATKAAKKAEAERKAKLDAKKAAMRERSAGKQDKQSKKDKSKSSTSVKPLTKAVDDKSLSFGNIKIQGDAVSTGGKVMKKEQKKATDKQILKKVLERQEKIDKLKGTEKGAALEESDKWSSALKKAAGEKVLDDAKLLKKKIQRKEKEKKKSAKKWDDRKKTQLEEAIEKKQKKADRIQKRNEQISAKWAGKGSKKKASKSAGKKGKK